MKLDLKQLLEDDKFNSLKGFPLALAVSGVFLFANLLFWLFAIPDIEAETEALQSEQNQLNGKIGALDKEIAQLKKDFSEIPQLTAQYKAELEKGTFGPEDRLKANTILAEVKTRHFKPLQFEPFGVYKLEMTPGATFGFSAEGKPQTWFASPVRISI